MTYLALNSGKFFSSNLVEKRSTGDLQMTYKIEKTCPTIFKTFSTVTWFYLLHWFFTINLLLDFNNYSCCLFPFSWIKYPSTHGILNRASHLKITLFLTNCDKVLKSNHFREIDTLLENEQNLLPMITIETRKWKHNLGWVAKYH